MKKHRFLAWVWVGALLTTGALGGLVVSRVGWSLAMALAIYGGDTEPMRPDLPYPWLVFGLSAVLVVVGVVWGFSRRDRPPDGDTKPHLLLAALPLVVAYGGSVAAALLPFVQIYRLWASIG